MAIQINQLTLNNNILDTQEQQLVASKDMTRFFGLPEDYIQFFVYSNTNTLLNSNNNFQEYSVVNNNLISFDPEKNISDLGYRVGTYNLYYNFLRPILTLNSNSDLFIQSISQDRLEIKISSTVESDDILYSNAISYINLIQDRTYFIEFYIDLGNNNLIPASSLVVERDINGNTSIIIKLFDSLPTNIGLNYPINVVEKIVNSQLYQAILTLDVIPTAVPTLRQANFSIEVDDKRIGSSDYFNFDQITSNSGSDLIINYISQSLPEINIDYTDYNNFIHFGSATQRLETFKNKLSDIESYTNYINSISTTNLDYISYQNKINNIIQNFDKYESYLYYESSSYTWPKSNLNKPYILFSVTSSEAITWYNYQYTSASYYDEFNNDNLVYGLPLYLQESDSFQYVKPFVQSIGQTFDDIWIYIKAFTDLWKAKNKLTEGISKDLVGLALQSLGISLYTDGDQDDLNLWLNGMNNEGTYTFQTSSFQTGITASEYTLSGQDEAKSIFKRIYHNLPTLLKSKGSNKFFNYLNTLYGIPETILYSQEYGGVDKTNNTSEFIYNKFTYGLKYNNSRYSYIYKPNVGVNNYGFKTLEFRFNPITGSGRQILISGFSVIDNIYNVFEDNVLNEGGILENEIYISNFINQLQSIPYKTNIMWGVTIEPTSSLGYDYGIVKLINYDTGSSTYISSSLLLPIYVTSSDGLYDWWNISITEKSTNQYTLNVQNEIDGKIGHQTSSVLTTVSPLDNKDYYISIGNINPSGGITVPSQFGSGLCYSQIQEVRGWSEILNTSSLNTHTLNPESYIGNSESSSYDNLLWRFPLGNNLNIYNHSIILSLTGSQPKPNTNNYLIFSGSWSGSDYNSFVETYYSTPAVGGYSTPVTDKIRIVSQPTSSNILHPQKSIFYPNPSNNKTKDIHLTQTGLSPQDQINNDIIAQLGESYNLDNIIGNPLTSNTVSYQELEILRNQYFKKYKNNYNYKDFVQLIETFHKSLFRYISESIPGRSEEATGIVIKPHILERSKVKRYEPTIDTSSYEGDIHIGYITASNPGDYCCSRNSPFNEAFFNGNFSGSEILMDSYYTQHNPFLIDPVTEDTKSFSEQYGGWDALNNNVSSNLISKYKKIEVRESSSLYLANYEFQDSYLTNTSYITSRELGVKTTAYDFNLPLISGSIPVTESLSNVDRKIPFMLFTDWAGNSLAEKYGTSNYHIKWLIDEDGNVFKPQESSSYYWNTDQAFGAQTPINVVAYSGDGNTSQDYETTVYMPLKNYDVILYSETGSLGTDYLQPGFYSSIEFETIPDIYNLQATNLLIYQTSSQFLFNSIDYSVINFSNIVRDNQNSWDPSSFSYVFSQTSSLTDSLYKVNITSNLQFGTNTNGIFEFYLTKNGNIFSPLKTESISVGGSPGTSSINITYSDFFKPEDYLQIYYKRTSGLATGSILNNSYFEINTITSSLNVTSSYFYTLDNINLRSNSFRGIYSLYSQTLINNSGFSQPIPFILQKYDQIRFEGNESKVYTIMEVEYTKADGHLRLQLDRNISTTATNINNFSIRRLVDSTGFIILNNNPIFQTGVSPSFIIPKYPSDKLKNNLDNIIQNLYQKNLL